MNKKLMQGNISNAKGTTDTFSFKIPITKNIEPMIISIYALSEDFEEDRFSPELFLKNICILSIFFKSESKSVIALCLSKACIGHQLITRLAVPTVILSPAFSLMYLSSGMRLPFKKVPFVLPSSRKK